jgi:hypothetical protein
MLLCCSFFFFVYEHLMHLRSLTHLVAVCCVVSFVYRVTQIMQLNQNARSK